MDYIKKARASEAKIDTKTRPLLHGDAALLPFRRFVFVEPKLFPDANVYQAVHKTAKTKDFGEYQVEHSHSADETYLFIGNNEDLTGLKAEMVIDGVKHAFDSPASAFVPKGVKHKYRFLEGSGLMVVTLLKKKYGFQK